MFIDARDFAEGIDISCVSIRYKGDGATRECSSMWKTALIDGVGLCEDQVRCVGVTASAISHSKIKVIEAIALAITHRVCATVYYLCGECKRNIFQVKVASLCYSHKNNESSRACRFNNTWGGSFV